MKILTLDKKDYNIMHVQIVILSNINNTSIIDKISLIQQN